ncbi:MAG: bis(5'-nucleosyl)-tetraphosphatase (symmetrical) YqeK [Firmicutes bacterium]|nr:bis(5'-nucleosyl)-tetraphosphatase (symmetrical) YqeK [Bacillota bacterium]MDD4264145.1 bis(5'-nucleosyl)-tetraphosphatase (symmetrical) YqeK [Bacillota bacterium]MDD4694598.1 bis(5'-nucleosyl)-tetraphosphatase (symmetrical) YqeK [Bacillota bacterium]
MNNQDKVFEFVKSRVTQTRFEHSKRVAQIAVKLAKKYGFDENKAFLSGMLHDICRELSTDRLLDLAKQYKIDVDQYEKDWPLGLHGKIAAKELATSFALDKEVEEAIKFHVTGYPKMGNIARILYLADKIEEGRNYLGVEKIRLLAFDDYNKALLEAIDNSLLYLIERHLPIHPDTLAFRNELLLEENKKIHKNWS